MNIPWKRICLGFVIGLIFILLITYTNSILDLYPIDFNNYWYASKLFLQGQNPYTEIEFFSPPWLAFFISPLLLLPRNAASIVWFFINLFSLATISIISISWLGFDSKPQRYLAITLALLLPGSLFSYITGQVSPLVAASIVFIAWQISTSIRSGWLLSLAILIVMIKPHIVILPLTLCFLELIHQRQWKVLIKVIFAVTFIASVSFLVLPDWIQSLIKAWIQGDYRGGKPGLISPGYLGFNELGFPFWILMLFGLYGVIRWWRNGLTYEVVAFSMAANLLVIPYSRSYDFVVLIFPVISLLVFKSRWFYLLFPLTLLANFILPFTILSILTPISVIIAILLMNLIEQKRSHNLSKNLL